MNPHLLDPVPATGHSLPAAAAAAAATASRRAAPTPPRPGDERARSGDALSLVAGIWFVTTMAGQLLMAAYVAVLYGRAAWEGEPERWNQILHNGHIAGDTTGNAVLALHLIFAVVIVLLGGLQLIPAIRRRWPAFHRWSGRVYLGAALILSLGGLYLVWSRDSLSGLTNDLAISLNALLILAFAVMTLHTAMTRRLVAHRRWALRLFIAVGGVWFFRVGLMFWLLVNQGPVGFDPATFRGPALVVLGFAQFLLPLAVLELYLRAQASDRPHFRRIVAVNLAVLTAVMATRIFAASAVMWLPRL